VELFLEKIMDDPMILLTSGASCKTASLDGKLWDHPEVLYTIWHLAPILAYLKELAATFFRGGPETWRWFTAEYAPGGVIDTASAALRMITWMPTTNDVNEGSLGSQHVIKRKIPRATDITLNSAMRYKWNKMGTYIKSLSSFKLKFLRNKPEY